MIDAAMLVERGESFRDVDDLESFTTLMQDVVEQCGFRYFSVVAREPRRFAGSGEMFFAHNYPSAWEERYVERDYFRHDPALRTTAGDRPLLRWHEAGRCDVFEEASEFGAASGLTMAVGSPGVQGHASFASELGRIDPEKELACHFLSFYVCSAAMRVADYVASDAEKSLTARELECLRWVCEGKTSWEVSRILCVAERTVLFHLSNTQRKLGTSNRHHSVAKAVVLGLLKNS